MEQKIYDHCLKSHNYGNAKHKLDVLGLVANDQHCDEHGNASAESREEQQRFFGCAKLNSVLFGDLLVVNADDYRDQRNDGNIRQKNRQNEVFLNEIYHNNSPFNILCY